METLRLSYQTSEQLRMFRHKAEQLIKERGDSKPLDISALEIEELMHELQVFQIELEMQNDELKLSAEYLEAERAKFSGLYDLAPVGYFILNKFASVIEANTTAVNMLATARIEIINRRFQGYIAPGETDVFYNFIRKMAAFNSRHSCQLRMLAADGKTFFAQIEGTSILNKQTGDLQFYIAVIDITKRRESEQLLEESNERLKMTLEATLTGTWEVDLAKKKIILDENSYTIYGFTPWAFDGKYETLFQLVHPLDRASVKKSFLAATSSDAELDMEYRILLDETGTRHIAARGHKIRQESGGVRFVGIFIDVTEKKKLQEEADTLLKQHERSVVAAGLQAQEKERSRISEALHDSVCQLLYGIKLNLQNHSRANALTEPLNNINTLLDKAIQEARNISFELAPSILTDFGLPDSIREMAKRLTTPGFAIKVKMLGATERLKPDLEISAFRIIQELVNNSIKHGHATEACITVNNLKNLLYIEVSDNGIGINTADPEYLTSGSGLLSIKNRVNLFNGSFDIKNNRQTGTTVNVTLKIE